MEIQARDLEIETSRHGVPGDEFGKVRITHVPSGETEAAEYGDNRKHRSLIQAQNVILQRLRVKLAPPMEKRAKQTIIGLGFNLANAGRVHHEARKRLMKINALGEKTEPDVAFTLTMEYLKADESFKELVREAQMHRAMYERLTKET